MMKKMSLVRGDTLEDDSARENHNEELSNAHEEGNQLIVLATLILL